MLRFLRIFKSNEDDTFNLEEDSRRILLLDVEGTLSPLSGIPSKEKILRIQGDWGSWAVRKKVADWVLEISKKHRILFTSSWNEESSAIADAIGLEEFEYLETEKDSDGQSQNPDVWYKLSAVEKLLEEAEDRHIVWVDNELDDIESLSEKYKKLHVFKVDGLKGLTNSDMIAVTNLLNFI